MLREKSPDNTNIVTEGRIGEVLQNRSTQRETGKASKNYSGIGHVGRQKSDETGRNRKTCRCKPPNCE